MKSGDFVAVTKHAGRGRPPAGAVPVTRYGKVVKARGERVVVEIDGVRETACRRQIRPITLPADVAQRLESVFSGGVA